MSRRTQFAQTRFIRSRIAHSDCHEVTEQPDVYYVLAWNFKEEILERYKHLAEAGVEFYFPIQMDEWSC